ncbi:MAG: topoisomerase DNA-binding C4 zinc finger domain-containing protein [Bdellovibrio sp.]|nr:topoisomerase DNA-binding C4 zinc finger domain-containing protein [Methylotenera sp.]
MIFRNGNPNFWGCTNYPNCRNTMKINNRRLI